MGFSRVTVVAGHTSQYPDPIRFRPGDVLELGKRDTEFPGWIWVRTADGKEGWAPENFIEPHSRSEGVGTRSGGVATRSGGVATRSGGIATVDYTARELNTRAGELVVVHRELNEWLWVENKSGDRGWIPKRTVAEVSD